MRVYVTDTCLVDQRARVILSLMKNIPIWGSCFPSTILETMKHGAEWNTRRSRFKKIEYLSTLTLPSFIRNWQPFKIVGLNHFTSLIFCPFVFCSMDIFLMLSFLKTSGEEQIIVNLKYLLPNASCLQCRILTGGWMERYCPSIVTTWLKCKKTTSFSVSSFLLSFHMDTYMLSLSPIKQRSSVCSGFMFPSTLSPHPVTQTPSASWPEVMAASVDPFPLNDTPPPLPAKKHRRQQPEEQQVPRHWCSELGHLILTAKLRMWNLSPTFPKIIFKKTRCMLLCWEFFV